MKRYPILCVAVFAALVLPADTAEARVQCGAYTTRECRAEIDPAAAIFVGELVQLTARDDVPAGEHGAPSADVVFRVVESIRGDAAVGDTLVVHWQGWSEVSGGRSVGGCSLPHIADPGPNRYLVIAQSAPGAPGRTTQLTVSNRTTSQRVNRTRRDLITRVRRIARRRR